VPVNGFGGMVQWQKVIGTRQAFTAGTDWRWVDGESQEEAYVAAVPTVLDGVTQKATLSVTRFSGGSQQSQGAFVQDVITPVEKLIVTLNARVDRHRRADGEQQADASRRH
jgi:hypothetical protein